MNTPNLFDYATSELSQDAFLLWLLKWGDNSFADADKGLNAISKKVIRCMLEADEKFEVKTVEVYKQMEKIDVFAIVNNTHAIIIEDKTNTSEHSKQIARYTDYIKSTYPNLVLKCVYYKSGNECVQSLRNTANKFHEAHPDVAALKILSRRELLDLLKSEESSNIILNSYIDKLQRLEDSTNSYLSLPVDKWSWRAWQGFYMALEETGLTFNKEENFGWGAVPQKDGGFQGCWFSFLPLPELDQSRLYIQIEGYPNDIENTKVCFKISNIAANQGSVRQEWSRKVISLAHERGYDGIKKPTRFGKGKYMTVACISGKEFFGEGIIDFQKITDLLYDYRYIVKTLTRRTIRIYEKPFMVKSLSKEAVCYFLIEFKRKGRLNGFYKAQHIIADANVHQDENGYWIGSIEGTWDIDKAERVWEWEYAMRDFHSIYIDGQQYEIVFLDFE